MKTISYNPQVALSILLAAVVFREHGDYAIIKVDSDETDFEKIILDETGKAATDSHIVDILKNEDETEKGIFLALGIIADLSDLNDFDTQLKLHKLYIGDSATINEVISKGKSIGNYLIAKGNDTSIPEIKREDVQNIEGKKGNFVWINGEIVFKESEEGTWIIVSNDYLDSILKSKSSETIPDDKAVKENSSELPEETIESEVKENGMDVSLPDQPSSGDNNPQKTKKTGDDLTK